jgi:protein involved in ribonucleotide reduction
MELLKRLYEYLREALRTISCDNTTRLTETFLETENVSKEKITEMLHNFEMEGGYCDCEIYHNILTNLFDEENENE